jgi:peroxiredoxin Q/BCP
MKNAVVVGMSADSPQKQKKFCDKQNFEYPMLCDESKDVLKAYGVWGKKKFMGREYNGIFRNTYVIDENGVIEKAYHKVKVKTHAQDILNDLG